MQNRPADVPAAAALLAARSERRLLAGLDPGTAPADVDAAYRAQTAQIAALGGHGGWKVGAAGPEAEPMCAPLPRAAIHPGPAALDRDGFQFAGIEVEIAFRFGRALPPRRQPWSQAEVLAAVESVHAAIEILDSRYADWTARSSLEQCADLCSNGALIVGAAGSAPATIDQRRQSAELWSGPSRVAARTGGNTAGEVQRLLVWLANHAAARGLPISPGDVVTTGSCTPPYFARAGERLRGVLPGLGEVELRLL